MKRPCFSPPIRLISPAILAALALAALPSLLACPVPVYQYSLEHWETDPYIAVIRSEGALSEEQLAAVALLEAAASGNGERAPANLELRRDGAPDGAGSARIDLYYPEISGIRVPAWTGELSLENVEAIVDSPLRAETASLLADRTSAVWVLLESGDRSADREAEGVLRRELELAAKTAVVPETAEWGGETVEIDHQVSFEILRLRRDDPAERVFVEMLLASEPDLKSDFNDQPMAFPVYGRGLILYALVGKGINAATIRSATEFLTGPCSCQIKAANPGTDLLLSMDWDAAIEATTPAAVGGTTGTGGFLRGLDEAEGETGQQP